MKVLSGSRNYWSHLRTTDRSLHNAALIFQKLYFKAEKAKLDLKFLLRCRYNNITPKFVRWKNLKSKSLKLRNTYDRKILKEAIQDKHISLKELNTELRVHKTLISTQTSWLKFVASKYHVKKPMDEKLREVSDRHERKYTSLLKEYNILIGLRQNPMKSSLT